MNATSMVQSFRNWRRARRIQQVRASYATLQEMHRDLEGIRRRAEEMEREESAFNAMGIVERERAALAKAGLTHEGSIVRKECMLTFDEYGRKRDFHTTIIAVEVSFYSVSLKLASLPRGTGHTLHYNKDEGWYFYYYQPGPIAFSGGTERLANIKLAIFN